MLRGVSDENTMSNPTFKDHFSASAASYAEFRPRYPSALFDLVASLPERRGTAWDCATGNGQAAVPLADRFEHVIATDASKEQIAHATPHPRVSYGVALADESGLEARSVDLVTVAQALHWFPLDRFFAEVRRVAAPGGALAVWCYTRPVLQGELDSLLIRYYSGTCKPYWAPDRALVDEGYRSISLPIDEIEAPPMFIESRQTLAEFGGYVRTWSASVKLAKAIGRDAVVDLESELGPLWGGTDARQLVRWPIVVRAGRVRGAD
jgi:ubiquinone/menaquinone biosynthesis C-methylase UbiE